MIKNNKMPELASSRFYNNNLIDKEEYTSSQTKRHALKHQKKRNKKYYESIANELTDTDFYQNKDDVMLCLGTRNNWERDCIIEISNNKNILSVDISPNSNADIITDFNELKLPFSVGVIFSNSIDHAIQPSKTYLSWLSCLSLGGTLIVDFDIVTDVITKADCSLFEKEKIDKFLDFLIENKCISKNTKKYITINGYYRTIVRRNKQSD